MSNGYCLNFQQINSLIKDGRLVSNFSLEKRIQPTSFDSVLSDEVFVLDTEGHGLFHPKQGEQIYRTLLKELSSRQRKRVSISEGFEQKVGFTYLYHLEDKVKMASGERVKSSQKSSYGRLFQEARLLADYNPAFDEILPEYSGDRLIDLWLLVQPTQFNGIVHSGISVNQLRFFNGDARLTPTEIKERTDQAPILWMRDKSGNLVPANHYIGEGLRIHTNLEGIASNGVIALRARNNPAPIDFSKKAHYITEEYFEPIIGKINVKPKEKYLMASLEVLRTPKDLSMETNRYSHVGVMGKIDQAGFIDVNFQGDLVFEITSEEITGRNFRHGMPLTELNLFRCSEDPDQVYGKDLGSNYQGQEGPRVSKHFIISDYKELSKQYEKLNKPVLVQDARLLKALRKADEGFELGQPKDLSDIVNSSFFHKRYDCEKDEDILQLIPYIVIFDNKQNVFSYERAKNIKDYGDKRLFEKHSIGVGGHVGESDGPTNYLVNCANREVREEVKIYGQTLNQKLVGTLFSREKEVDRVHFGLIYKIHVDGTVVPNYEEGSTISGRMISIEELVTDSQIKDKYETWSRLLVPNLQKIYEA